MFGGVGGRGYTFHWQDGDTHITVTPEIRVQATSMIKYYYIPRLEEPTLSNEDLFYGKGFSPCSELRRLKRLQDLTEWERLLFSVLNMIKSVLL